MGRKIPMPGDKVGPMSLPASYRTYQLVQMGIIKGRYSNAKMLWEIPDGSGGWKEVNTPKRLIGATRACSGKLHNPD